MRLILDTSALIALRKGDEAAKRALEDRRQKVDDIGMSRLSEYELRVGGEFLWKKHGDAREYAWLEDILEWLSVYEVGRDVVARAAGVQAESMAKGNPLPDMDLLVALSGGAGSELLTFDEDQLGMKEKLRAKGVVVTFLGERKGAVGHQR